MIFTTVPARPNVTPSALFKMQRNPSDVACQISDAPVFGVSELLNVEFMKFAQYFYLHVACYAKKESVPFGSFIPLGENDHDTTFNSPSVGISFKSNLSQDRVEKAEALGLVRESVGRTTFYRGNLARDQIQSIILLGAEAVTFVPYGLTDLSGLLAFYTFTRLLDCSFAAIPAAAFNAKVEPAEEYRVYVQCFSIFHGDDEDDDIDPEQAARLLKRLKREGGDLASLLSSIGLGSKADIEAEETFSDEEVEGGEQAMEEDS